MGSCRARNASARTCDLPKPRAPRLLPLPYTLGAEPDAFSPMSGQDQEVLGSLAYLSGVADNNTSVSKFIAGLSNSVYSEFMNAAGAI